MRVALSSFVGRLWTIDWLTKVDKQFFTSCHKVLMSSYLRYPATSLCVLGKAESASREEHFPGSSSV